LTNGQDSLSGSLQQLRTQLGHAGQLALDQGDMARDGLSLEPLDEISESIAVAVEVGMVDLVRIDA
jgi:hypothetical protein